MIRNMRARPLKLLKRPTQSRSIETVKVIVEAAARVLEQDGLTGYTTHAIAERAGVSVGSFYQYFPNKDAVTVVLIEREAEQLLSELKLGGEMECAEDALHFIISVSVRQQLRRPSLARLLDIEEHRLPVEPTTTRVLEAFTDAVQRQLIKLERCHTEYPEKAPTDIFAICRGMADLAGEMGENDPDCLEKRTTSAVFGYLGFSRSRFLEGKTSPYSLRAIDT